MQTVTLDPVWIPLSNGLRLAATIRLPVDAEAHPVPALLEYLPYRRRDGTVLRDATLHQFYAEQGYAAVRLDIRGTGDSDGVITDEYTPEEQADAVEAIAWLAAQPWCNGRVGMFGISWGGFNALQVAAHRPPALKAIITLCSTDDRFRDECHYMGGALLTNSLGWGMMAFQYAAQPPDPQIVGPAWRDIWRHRLDNLRLFAADWLEHQSDDAYWQQGSVATDYAAITAPVLAIGGWADGYSNAIPRLMENLRCPRKAWIGPWAHAYPHRAEPGPTMDYPAESLRWWDHWLKDADTGVTSDPTYRVHLQDSVRPGVHASRPGKWLALDAWPRPPSSGLRPPSPTGGEGVGARSRVTPSPLVGEGARRADEGAFLSAREILVHTPLTLGATFGEWCPYSSTDLPADQSPDDALSTCLDTPVPAAILGAPTVTLTATTRERQTLVLRLNEVWPDGASANITYGVINLPPGTTTATVALNDIAHRFTPGNTLRLALSTGSWPLLWPAAGQGAVEIDTLALHLPLLIAETPAPRFAPAATYAQSEVTARSHPVTRSTDGTTITVPRYDTELTVHTTGTVARRDAVERFTLNPADPLSVRMDMISDWSLTQPGWSTSTHAEMTLTATSTHFHLDASLTARDGDTELARRIFTHRIPRRTI
jgi:putative CocE/NonD family hydrolase